LVEVPAYTLYKVPDQVSDREAAVVEPLAVGLHALRRARFNAGESVVIFGYGMIGASTASIAIATGAASVQVVEPTSQRRELALEMGATEAYDPQKTDVRAEVRLRTSSRGADVVVDSTGNPEVLKSAVEASRRGGRVVLVGIGHHAAQIDPDRLVYFEREVVGALGYQFDHPAVLALLATGRLPVDRFFGEVIGLADIVGAGLQRTMDDRASPLRIPVNPVP
jgi:(R,R)-butanediol dehydrogenase/meso-butanediol dehydrogenase/diacetyl reductase